MDSLGSVMGLGIPMSHSTRRHTMRNELEEIVIGLIWMVIAASIGMFIGILLEVV